jgi:hypothetical protein
MRKHFTLVVIPATAFSGGAQLKAPPVLGTDDNLTRLLSVLLAWSPTIVALVFGSGAASTLAKAFDQKENQLCPF